jgi:hypothetical protein
MVTVFVGFVLAIRTGAMIIRLCLRAYGKLTAAPNFVNRGGKGEPVIWKHSNRHEK